MPSQQEHGSMSDDDFDFGDTDECVIQGQPLETRPQDQGRSLTPNQVPPLSSNQKSQQQQRLEIPKSPQMQTSLKEERNFRSDHKSQSFVSANKSANSSKLQKPLNMQASFLQQTMQSRAAAPLLLNQSKSHNTFNNNQIQNDDPEMQSDFNKAYLKLVQKVYQEQGANILLSQHELNKLAHTQNNLSVQDFNQRIQQTLENKQQKTKMLQEIKKQSEMQECTFKPQVYSQKQQRNFDQFLKDQVQFEEQRNKKKQEMIEREAVEKQKIKHQPEVNRKSARIVELKKKQSQGSGAEPIYNRLHNIHQERLQKNIQMTYQEESRNFKKVKSEANFLSARSRERFSGKSMENPLYEDAKIRQERQEQKKKEIQRLKEEQIQATKPPAGNNSSKYAAQKFEKEFYFMVHQIMDETQRRSEQEDFNLREYDDKRLNYVKLGQLLNELGYIPVNIAHDSIERELQFDLWNLLQGEDSNGITVLNLKKILLAIQGITLDSQPTETYISNTSNNKEAGSLPSLSYDQQGVLKLSQQEVNKLFVRFKALYVNRVHHMGQYKKVKHVENVCTFKPQISKTTELLAQQRRMKLLQSEAVENNADHLNNMQEQQMNSEGQPGKVDIVQILLHPMHLDQQWKQTAKQMLEAKELEECTFKPKVTQMEYSSRISSRGQDKCLELYQRAQNNARGKRDKTRDEYEFEKGREECTFQPNIEESQRNMDTFHYGSGRAIGESEYMTTSEDITQNIKGYQMVMARLKKGREDREKVKAMHQRGIPGTVTDESLLQPLTFTQNQTYKGAFSTFSYNPSPPHQANDNHHQIYRSQRSQQQDKENRQVKSARGVSKPPTEKENMNANQMFNTSSSNNFNSGNQNKAQKSKASVNSRYSSSSHDQQQVMYKLPGGKIEEQVNIDAYYDEGNSLTNLMMAGPAKQPLLYVDVNLGPGKSERIVVYEGDTADLLAEKFSQTHGLDANMRGKLSQLLDSQIAGLLEKIDEEQNSVHSDVQ